MSNFGEWWFAGVQAADMEDIRYLFTSGGDSTERSKGLSAIQGYYRPPSQAQC